MKLVKAMATVAGMTALSRIAGFARDVLTAAYVGAGPIGDAFFVALKLPNFFRRITAEGAFSVSFVPQYSKMIEAESKKEADYFASNAFMVMLSILSVFTVIIVILMPYVLSLIAPGFSDDPERATMAVEFSRITFPYLLLMSLAALLGGVLNAVDRFAPFAFAPVIFNLSLIGALLVSQHFETAGHAMSWGLLCSGFLQLGFLWGCVKRAGVRMTFPRPHIDANIRHVFKLMGPAMIGAGVMHINLFVDMIIASFLATGSISYLYYADRLNQLPLGTVGIAVGTALLPMLSRAFARGDKEESIDLFNRALEYCLLLALPAAIALCVIPHILMTVLFERGAFTAQDSAASATVLLCYAIGLPPYIATKVFSTAHWARHDTTTPVRIAIAATILNIVLGVIFIQFIGVAGIALGTGVVGWLQLMAHVYYLKDHPMAQFDKKFMKNMPKIVLSTCAMGCVLYIVASFLEPMIMAGSQTIRVLLLGGIVASGGLVYGVSILSLDVVRTRDLKRIFRDRRNRKKSKKAKTS